MHRIYKQRIHSLSYLTVIIMLLQIGIMPLKRKYKDNLKDDVRKEVDRTAAIATVEAVLGRILCNPPSWKDKDLNNIKSMVCRIGSDRVTYPLPLNETNPSASSSESSSIPDLTNGLGIALYKRGGIDISNAILQITAASSDMTNSKLVGDMVVGKAKDIPHRTWKIKAIDGDQMVITIRLDSTLNSKGKFLTTGAVIHVASAFPRVHGLWQLV